MHRKKRYFAYSVLAIIDVILIVSSFFLACFLYLGSVASFAGLLALSPTREPGAALTVILAYAILVSGAYALASVYGQTYIGRLRVAIIRVILINVCSIGLVVVLLFLLHLDDVSRMTLFLFAVLSTFFVCAKIVAANEIFLIVRKRNRKLQKTILVGSGSLARQYIKAINESNSRAEEIVGYVDVDAEGDQALIADVMRLGSIHGLDQLLRESDVEKVVIALEPASYSDIGIVTSAADQSGVELELVPFYNDFMPRRPDIDSVEGIKLVNLRSMPLSNPFNSAVKRTADIVVSGTIIIAFSWLYAILAIGVKASSPGPVFFKQRRVGKGNKPFEMLKFRSMRVNDESDTAWSTDVDPRKTRFGSFIRKFSLDELPQFFNVFVGDMSVVGPRPEIPHYVKEFRDQYPRYMLRHQIRPGITGWAQVNGLRGDTSIDERIQADLWYIDHWTPSLDLAIFAKTVFGGFVNSEKLS